MTAPTRRFVRDRIDQAAADHERAATVIARLRSENPDVPAEELENTLAGSHARLALKLANLRLEFWRGLDR